MWREEKSVSECISSLAHFVLCFELEFIAVSCNQGCPKHGCNVFIVKLQNEIIFNWKKNAIYFILKS